MKDDRYDEILVVLALLAPLLLFALNKWRTSLDAWYVPLDGTGSRYFGAQFERDAARWLQESGSVGPELVVIADRDCPCTKATLKQLDDALTLARRPAVRVVVRDVRDITIQSAAWKQLVSAVPATPTLLAIDEQRLLYAGPMTSGNFCTAAVGKVLGLAALQSRNRAAIFNVIDKGCYCRLP